MKIDSCSLVRQLSRIPPTSVGFSRSASFTSLWRRLMTNLLFSSEIDHGRHGTSQNFTNRQAVTSVPSVRDDLAQQGRWPVWALSFRQPPHVTRLSRPVRMPPLFECNHGKNRVALPMLRRAKKRQRPRRLGIGRGLFQPGVMNKHGV